MTCNPSPDHRAAPRPPSRSGCHMTPSTRDRRRPHRASLGRTERSRDTTVLPPAHRRINLERELEVFSQLLQVRPRCSLGQRSRNHVGPLGAPGARAASSPSNRRYGGGHLALACDATNARWPQIAALDRPAFVPRTTGKRQEMTGTAGASNPQVRNRIRASPQVARSASRTLSRWRHGFESPLGLLRCRCRGAERLRRGPA